MLWLLLACAGPPAGGPDDSGTADGGASDGGASDGGVTDGIGLRATPHAEQGSLLEVSWQQPRAGATALSWTLDGVSTSTSSRDLDVGPQAQLLAGVPYGATVAVQLVVDGEALAETTASTAALPEGVPQPTLLHSQAEAWEPELRWLLLSTPAEGGSWGGTWWTSIVDRQGRVVWARQSPTRRVSMHVQTSAAGTALLIDHNSFWATFDGGAASQVLRLKLDGTVLETIDTPGLHHPFTELPDGRMAWGGRDGMDEQLVLREVDGTLRVLWTCAAFLGSIGEGGYCGSNSLRYDAARDSFLFSFYSFETVIELDAATGQALRWFGHLDGSYSFADEGSAFWWQHGAHWTEAGTLLLSSKDAQVGTETVAREYAVDEEAGTLTELWSFGEGQGIYGSEMGEAWRLPGGNTLHNYGSTARVREVTPDGGVVWDLEWDSGLYIGRMTALSDLEPLLP